MARALAIFLVFLAIPAFVAWMQNAKLRPWLYVAVGMLPFTVNAWNLDAALVNWAMWNSYAKGIVVTLLDSLCLAIIIAHRRPRGMPPLGWFIVAYMVAALFSVTQATVKPAAFFYAFQLLRMLLVFVAVAKIAGDEGALKWLAVGLSLGVSYQAAICIQQKLSGAFQTAGTMGHQNLLGLMAHFVNLPLLAMLLGGVRSRLLMLGVLSSLVVVGLGASRGAVGFTLIGIALLCVLSLARHATARKWRTIGFAALVLAMTSPLILQGMAGRFVQLSNPGGGDERAAFERAAKAMWKDHPMGVGANQYVLIANADGYSQRAGVIWNFASRSAKVHNTYLLVAAETGWFGLLSFVALFVAIIVTGLKFAFEDRRDRRGDMVLGSTVAVIVTAGHNLYEWIWVTYQAQYVFAISMGIIAGLVRARALERRALRRQRVAAGWAPAPPAAGALAHAPGVHGA